MTIEDRFLFLNKVHLKVSVKDFGFHLGQVVRADKQRYEMQRTIHRMCAYILACNVTVIVNVK